MELYDNDAMFAELCDNLRRFAEERSAALKKRDLEREADPEWHRSNDLTGMIRTTPKRRRTAAISTGGSCAGT